MWLPALVATIACRLTAQEEPLYRGELYVGVDASSDISVQAVSLIWGKYADGFPVTSLYSGGSETGQLSLTFDNCDRIDVAPELIGYQASQLIGIQTTGTRNILLPSGGQCLKGFCSPDLGPIRMIIFC